MQSELFHESIEDALGATINAIGGFKKVSSDLWPTMKLATAYSRLKACLDETKNEKLTPGEIEMLVRAGREHGVHYYMRYMAQSCGYHEPVPAEPEDERDILQRDFIQATKHLDTIYKRLERLQGPTLAQRQAG